MADKLLSIQDSTLQNIANAIRSKGNTSSPLTFPQGFVSALQNITTEATVTPKIAAQQKTLTPNDTSFGVQAGFHDGNDRVSIVTQSKTVTPSTSQQVVTPDPNKFLSGVVVQPINVAGFSIQKGFWTTGQTSVFSMSGLSFAPIGAMLVLQKYTGNSGLDKVFCVSTQFGQYATQAYGINGAYTPDEPSTDFYFTPIVSLTNAGITIQATDSCYFCGTYHYFVWGN